jgi:hypothetical protein
VLASYEVDEAFLTQPELDDINLQADYVRQPGLLSDLIKA